MKCRPPQLARLGVQLVIHGGNSSEVNDELLHACMNSNTKQDTKIQIIQRKLQSYLLILSTASTDVHHILGKEFVSLNPPLIFHASIRLDIGVGFWYIRLT